MTTDNARRIQDVARRLADSFAALASARFTRNTIRTERKMRPQPGPQTPGNGHAVTMMVTESTHLATIIRTIRTTGGEYLGTEPARLTRWLHTNATTVAQDPNILDILADLDGIGERINTYLYGPPTTDLTAPEPRQYAATIAQRLATMGHRISPDTLRQWAHRSASTPTPITVELWNGKSRYLLTEVLAYIQWRASKTS